MVLIPHIPMLPWNCDFKDVNMVVRVVTDVSLLPWIYLRLSSVVRYFISPAVLSSYCGLWKIALVLGRISSCYGRGHAIRHVFKNILKMEVLFDCRMIQKEIIINGLLILSEMFSCLFDSKPGHLLQMIIFLVIVSALCSRRTLNYIREWKEYFPTKS